MTKASEYHEGESLMVAVPQQVFRSRVSWLCYEATRSWLVCSLLSCSLLGLISLFTLDYSFKFTVGIISLLLFYVVILYPTWRPRSANRVVSKNRAQLAKVIYEVAPGTDSQKWDEVTYQMNCFLYQEGLWRTPYCMFSRGICQQYFRVYLLKASLDGTLAVQDSSELGDQKDYAEACVESYQRAVRDEYERMLSIELPDSLGEYQTLPKDVYRNKFTWTLQYFANKKFLALVFFFVMSAGNDLMYAWAHRASYSNVAFDCFLILGCIIGEVSSFLSLKYNKVGISDRMRFLATIVKVSNGTRSERLDQVARYMNYYLRSEEVWKGSEEYFYDGRECLSFFQKQLAPLASSKKQKGNVNLIAYYELEGFVSKAMNSLDLSA